MSRPEDRQREDVDSDRDTRRGDADDVGDTRAVEIGGITTGSSAGTGPRPVSDAAVSENLEQGRRTHDDDGAA
jgi:hypothetical protein